MTARISVSNVFGLGDNMISIAENRNCEEAMKEFPDKFFDLVLADPHYGIGEDGSKGSSRNKNHRVDKRNGVPILVKDKQYKLLKDKKPSKEFFDEMFRVSKFQIIFGGNYFTDMIPQANHWLVWDKCNGESDFSDCELAWTNFKYTSVRIIKYMWSGMFQGKSISEGTIAQGNKKLNEFRIHPNQKPVPLYKWILQNYAEPGFKILDTNLGSGSSRIACHDLDFDFWGYELDKHYFDEQEKRFQKHIAQPKLIPFNGIIKEERLLDFLEANKEV